MISYKALPKVTCVEFRISLTARSPFWCDYFELPLFPKIRMGILHFTLLHPLSDISVASSVEKTDMVDCVQ